MKRFSLDSFNDGHVAVTTLARVEGGGNAHDRKIRKRRELNDVNIEHKWRREDRKIFRDGVKEPFVVNTDKNDSPTITLLPFGSAEINAQAADNYQTALVGVLHAEGAMEATAHRAAAFERDQKRCYMKEVDYVKISYTDGSHDIL